MPYTSAQHGQDLVRLRRALHREPETGLELPKTQEKILSELRRLPVEITTGTALSSVTAVLRGGRPGPAVLLRADMDALPVAEDTGLDFASAVPDTAHACGHDLHMAALVGAARLLAERRDELRGDVVLMFQPGEEGYSGARRMVDEGVLDAAGERVVAAYAMHVLSGVLPQGAVATRPGPVMSAVDVLRVAVRGIGGHGGQPHHAKDPVVAACEMVMALQSLVTRRFDVFDPVVVNVGVLHAGGQHNVIPDQARFEASVRSFSAASQSRIRCGIERIVEGIAAAHELTTSVEHESLYPMMINNPTEAEFALGAARAVAGKERVIVLPGPQTASEDFAFVLNEVPGAYLFLGACPSTADPGTAPMNHSGQAMFDDAVLPQAAALLAGLATRRLEVAAGSDTN